MSDYKSISEAYYEKSIIYDSFSQAEDYPELIAKYIKPKIEDKIVLDLGCGTGKYAQLLAPVSKCYYGLDIATEQLKIAREKLCQNTKFFCSSAQDMPLPNQSVDIVLAAWAFGAISDLETRNQAFSEAERVIRKGNPIYVIENNGGCEFEQIIKNNTSNEEIQDWLLSNHFSKVSIIQTYFQFSNLQTAREIFCELGDANLSTEVSSSKVQHNIAIYAKVVA